MLQIEQALLNLLRNSIEAIGEAVRGAITIEATPAGDFVEIAVRDSGPGFPPDLIANPFLPFASTKAEGLGIGLALCRSIIEAHGGRLWLDTKLNPCARIINSVQPRGLSASNSSARLWSVLSLMHPAPWASRGP
jgi:signal transduction histidine kinase